MELLERSGCERELQTDPFGGWCSLDGSGGHNLEKTRGLPGLFFFGDTAWYFLEKDMPFPCSLFLERGFEHGNGMSFSRKYQAGSFLFWGYGLVLP